MGDKSKIEWTDASYTPIRARNLKTGKVGWHCEHATTGCEFCYAETLNKRLGTGLPFKPGHRSDIEIFLDDNMLLAPLRWKKPRMIFVCSMTDLFADFVPDEWIDKVFAVMALCPQHTFQVLTKRAARMRAYLADPLQHNRMELAAEAIKPSVCKPWSPKQILPRVLPNVWLGVSTERQKEADERIPLLLDTPAAIRFISAEPLLGPIDLNRIHHVGEGWEAKGSALDGTKLDWVIVGGESGHDARPMHPAWARSLRDQCKSASVPFFFKQWGAWLATDDSGDLAFTAPGFYFRNSTNKCWAYRVGKKAAGRLLDGITHDAMPSPKDHVITKPERRAGGE